MRQTILAWTAAGVAWALTGAVNGQDALDQRVAAGIAALQKGTVADVSKWCARLIPPEQRPAKDDTEARMVLHGAVMRAGASDSLKARLEKAFQETLTGNAPKPVKGFILQELQYIAGKGDLSAVAPLLVDPELSDGAARVIVNIGTKEAAAVLCAALPKSAGTVRLNLIQALADLSDPRAVPLLLDAAKDKDPVTRRAAFEALAATGDVRAADVLLAATNDSRPYARARAVNAYLSYLSKLASNNAAEAFARAKAFAAVHPNDMHIQCACLELFGKTGREAAVAPILDALTGGDVRTVRSAGKALQRLDPKLAAPHLLARLDSTPGPKRAALITALADLGVKGALPAIKQQVAGKDSVVRRAGILAMGRLAGAGAVNDLISLLADRREGVAQAAREALAAIRAPEVGATLARRATTAEPSLCTALLDIMAKRLDVSQRGTALALTEAESRDVRLAAWKAFGVLGAADQVSSAAERLANCTDPEELKAAGKALAMVCRRAAEPDVTGPGLTKAFQGAAPVAATFLVEVLPAAGGSVALQTAEKLATEGNGDVRTAAVRALAAWPEASAMPALKHVITNAVDPVRHVLAMRGYVRLLNLTDLPVSRKLELYDEALRLCKRKDEKTLVLAGLGGLKDLAALPKLEPFLKDKDLNGEAAAAIIRLAQQVRGDAAVKALRHVLSLVKNEALTKRARNALADIAKYAGCVVTWEVSGPYTDNNKGHTAIYPVPFLPETDPAKATWRRVVAEKDGRLNLLKLIGGNNRCAYMRCNILVPKQTEAKLFVGSDDGVKVWLNGNVVHENNVPRAFRWCEDSVPVVLLEGTNTLMLKITQGGGDWMGNARVTASDGTPISGMDFAVGPPVKRPLVPLRPKKLADGAPTAEKLGWRMSIQCWTFNRSTFFESVDRAARMGVRYLEMFPGQRVGGNFGNAKTNQNMSPEVMKAVREKLASVGIRVVNFGVTGIPADEAGRRKLFGWAKAMGIETICCEPNRKDLPGLEPYCKEYNINIALHNHPKPSRYWNPQTVLEACKGLSSHFGACADTGHWMRSGIKPLEAIKLLKGRIITFHFKDLNKMGRGAHDVHWGTGKANMPAILRELKTQGFKGVFSAEYEFNWGKNTEDVAACVRNFEAMAREIVLEEDGRWQVLFNMRDLNAWRSGAGGPPAPGWQIEGECLALKGKGGYIWTRERFADFVLDFEFNTEGNSGVFFRTDNPRNPVQTGIEMQIEKPTPPGKHSVGAIYDLVAPKQQTAKPGWNHVTLTARDNLIAVVMNGQSIITMDLNKWDTPGKNPDGTKNKFKRALKDFKRDGHIGFQDHGHPVRYRNIRIRKLETAR
ncbi:MAG: DUF1080 domain-containing protein [Kiritimatiellaeota bacterium]|nr:DUF1080 domain-containing protein [Kiritimatiellota bacterium]